MGFEPMRISPVELKSTDLTKLAYPRHNHITNGIFRFATIF